MVLPCEAALPPLQSLLPHRRRMAALRLACSSPYINPATARLLPSLPIQAPTGLRKEMRRPAVGLRNNYTPLKWDQYRPPRSTRRHLPIDSLYHSLLPLVRQVTVSPLASPHLLPGDVLPPDPPPKNYKVVKLLAKDMLKRDWETQCPSHPSYQYRPALIPYAFLGLDRFTGGLIYQMRAGASYLAAHTTWANQDAPKICQMGEEDEEAFPHAILRCPARSNERSLYLSKVDDVGPDSSLWGSLELVLGLCC